LGYTAIDPLIGGVKNVIKMAVIAVPPHTTGHPFPRGATLPRRENGLAAEVFPVSPTHFAR